MNTPEIGLTNEKKRKAETEETDPASKRAHQEEEQTIEEYMESLCKDLKVIATRIVKLLNFYKQVPPEVMKTRPMRTF